MHRYPCHGMCMAQTRVHWWFSASCSSPAVMVSGSPHIQPSAFAPLWPFGNLLPFICYAKSLLGIQLLVASITSETFTEEGEGYATLDFFGNNLSFCILYDSPRLQLTVPSQWKLLLMGALTAWPGARAVKAGWGMGCLAGSASPCACFPDGSQVQESKRNRRWVAPEPSQPSSFGD